MKIIQLKDVSSTEPQDVPELGIFPLELDDETEKVWRKRIKEEKLPLEIVNVKETGGES